MTDTPDERRRGLLRAAAAALALAPFTAIVPRLAGAADAARLSRLGLNENPWGPSPAAVRAIRAHLDNLWSYTDREAEELVELLAEREGVPPTQIVVGKLLAPLATRLAIERQAGAAFVFSTPGYRGFVDAAAAAGGRVVGVPLTPRLENDLDGLLARVDAQTAAVFVVNPHNPSGTLSPGDRFDEFLRAASARSLVIVDEAYLEYVADFDRRTAVRLTRAGHAVAVYRTFDKFYGLAALPLEYLVAPPALAASLRRAGLGSLRDLNRLAVVAASAALGDHDYPRRVRDGVAREREQWLTLLRERGVQHSASEANFVFFDAGRPHAESTRTFRDAGIEIARPHEELERWVRVSIGLPEANRRARRVAEALLR